MNDYDDADEALIEQQKARREAQLQQEAELRAMLREPAFRSFVWRVLERCNVYGDGFSIEKAAMAFSAGQRNIGLGIIRDLARADPLAYAQLQQENANERNDD